MTYSSGLVVVVKCNGRILRENKDLVTLPFNSEYSILIKNLESRKASVKISVDGKDVLDGKSLLVDPNCESELEGFLHGNQAKNKFKFIQKTKEISNFRGDRLDDGIIRVEYQFEKFIEKRQILLEEWRTQPFTWYQSSSPFDYTSNFPKTYYYSSLSNNISSTLSSNSRCFDEQSVPNQDEGITVKGSEINQNFDYSNVGVLEDQSRVIILRLVGTKNNELIQEPITVKSKIRCITCGRNSKPYTKYCSNCGTFLE